MDNFEQHRELFQMRRIMAGYCRWKLEMWQATRRLLKPLPETEAPEGRYSRCPVRPAAWGAWSLGSLASSQRNGAAND
jgi:hypothetical protein